MDDEGIDQSGQSGLLRIDIPTSTSEIDSESDSDLGSTPLCDEFDISKFTDKKSPLTEQEQQELNKEFLLQVEYGDVQCVLDLIAVGADVNAVDEGGNYLVEFQRCSALHKAKSIEMAKILIEAGADVNAVDAADKTPLHKAESIEMAKLLVEAGADVNAVDAAGNTPLHKAESIEMAKILIEAGADVNAVDAAGHTPLHKAKSIEMAKLLVEAGADVNAVDAEGNSPLHKEKSSQITHKPLSKNLARKVINIVKHFKDRIAEIRRDAQVGNPLYSDKAELFIKHGANIGRVNQKGETPLDYRLKRKLTVLEEGSEAEE
jgi:ankyrin repeat protein